MDDPRQSRAAASLPLQSRIDKVAPTLPPDFVPLGLLLQPSGMRVALTKPNTVLGRHSSADIRLPLPDVSRQHCRFVFGEGAWHIVDLDSTNGIFVNNQRVQRAALRTGDRIRIGGFIFEVGTGAAGQNATETAAA